MLRHWSELPTSGLRNASEGKWRAEERGAKPEGGSESYEKSTKTWCVWSGVRRREKAWLSYWSSTFVMLPFYSVTSHQFKLSQIDPCLLKAHFCLSILSIPLVAGTAKTSGSERERDTPYRCGWTVSGGRVAAGTWQTGATYWWGRCSSAAAGRWAAPWTPWDCATRWTWIAGREAAGCFSFGT